MPVTTVDDLVALLKPGQAIAGLDLGTKTIGLALSDRSLKFAHPRPVIRRKKFSADAEALLAAVSQDNVGAFVIGLPLHMDGSESPRSQAVRAFVRNFGRFSTIPFVMWDERLSTVAAERALIGMDVSRKRRSERIDSAAAAFILQGVLDRLASLPDESPPF